MKPDFKNIDITFLSTYPDFYLTINDGNIVSKAFKPKEQTIPNEALGMMKDMYADLSKEQKYSLPRTSTEYCGE